MPTENISYDIENGVGTLNISKPPVNAVSYEDVSSLEELLADLPRENELAFVFETGGEEAFIAGHDIDEFAETDPKREAEGTKVYVDFLRTLYELPIPTIAAIDGPALGTGMVAASFCDIRVVSPEATLGLPEIDVGAAAGYRTIRRLLPDGVARHLAFTGETIDGDRAYELGFASIRSEEPGAAARECAQSIASKSPDSVRAVKDLAVRHQPDWPLADFRRERERTEELLVGENAQEAVQAFLEDREPEFER